MRAWFLVPLLLGAAAAPAQSPPPSPADGAPVPGTAWACTTETLLQELPCTVEGRTAPRAASKELAKENQRQARLLAEELCTSFARGEGVEPEAALLRACLARVPAAVKRCGGDGSRRLLDDAGRFNPGHAGCYGALSAFARDMSVFIEATSACCGCVGTSCGGDGGQCLERLGAGRAPEGPLGVCLEGACASVCAESKLLRGQTSSSGRASPQRKQ
jgi:hypothetical protein